MAAAGPEQTANTSVVVDSLSPQAEEYLQDDNDEESRTEGGVLSGSMRDKEKKIGHRRVDKAGIVSYKKKTTSELMAAIQLGIGQSVGGLSSKPERDVLMQDFGVVEVVFFPSEGSNLTPAHHCSDFRFKTYAPVAFRYFRDLFGIQPDDFMLSLCNEPLKELFNPGASGSIFYLTQDDEFIIKTVQHKEADFLQKLLPGYFLNISQNKRTLLPKFYGLYCYQCGGKNIRFTVMNNLLPSTVKLHEKYDMKGSTYKRKASKNERSKSSPTLKDLDFIDIHPDGLIMEKDTLDALMKTLQRDCRVLESFKIMDYSLLVGIYNLDQVNRDKNTQTCVENPGGYGYEAVESTSGGNMALHRAKSMRTRIGQYSTPLESIQGNTDLVDDVEEDEDVPLGGIPARNAKGERLLIYLGIIDILQSFRLKKRLEHTVKAMVIDGDSISVHRPSYYAERFLRHHSSKVFRKGQSGLKHSPSKKRSLIKTKAVGGNTTAVGSNVADLPYIPSHGKGERSGRTISFSDEQGPTPGAVSGKPDLLPEYSRAASRSPSPRSPSPRSMRPDQVMNSNGNSKTQKRSDAFSLTTYQSEDALSAGTASTASLRGMTYGGGPPRGVSPPLSLSESTPTHTDFTEGTPSFTNSSPSCSSDVMDMGRPGNVLDSMDSPTSNSRSPDLARPAVSYAGRVFGPSSSTSPTYTTVPAPLYSGADVAVTSGRVQVVVIPESPPPPPFDGAGDGDVGRYRHSGSASSSKTASPARYAAPRGHLQQQHQQQTASSPGTTTASSSSPSSQSPSSSATLAATEDMSAVAADRDVNDNDDGADGVDLQLDDDDGGADAASETEMTHM